MAWPVSLQVGVTTLHAMHALHVLSFLLWGVEEGVHSSSRVVLVAYQVLQTLADVHCVVMLAFTRLLAEIVEEFVSVLDDLALHLLSLWGSVARLSITDVEVDLDPVEDRSTLALVVLVGLLVRLEASARVVAWCIQGFLAHLHLCDLLGSLWWVGIPGRVLAEDAV